MVEKINIDPMHDPVDSAAGPSITTGSTQETEEEPEMDVDQVLDWDLGDNSIFFFC